MFQIEWLHVEKCEAKVHTFFGEFASFKKMSHWVTAITEFVTCLLSIETLMNKQKIQVLIPTATLNLRHLWRSYQQGHNVSQVLFLFSVVNKHKPQVFWLIELFLEWFLVYRLPKRRHNCFHSPHHPQHTFHTIGIQQKPFFLLYLNALNFNLHLNIF